MGSFVKSIKKLIKSCDCDRECNAKRFKKNFKKWTSGNDHIDKLIQDIQLSDHSYNTCQALEWIPHNRFYDIEFIDDDEDSKLYKAKWIDGYINEWDNKHQTWRRKDQNGLVGLISLKNIDVILEYINKFRKDCRLFYGITQDSETRNYMIVAITCEECNNICSGKFFKLNFRNWTSGNDHIDKFIQDTQLSAHVDNEVFKKVLEWIPYNRFYNIEYIEKDGFDEVYRARWIDGYIYKWNYRQQNWERKDRNIFVNFKSLDNPEDITLEFINKAITVPHKVYGITQNPATKNYLMIWNEICENCNYICNASRFKLNFINWTSEWIPYDRFYDTEYIEKDGFNKVYKARWIDGYIYKWDYRLQNWKRKNHNMLVNFICLNDPADISLEFIDKTITVPHKVYGITQYPETKDYMIVWSEICEKCNCICNASYFKLNFVNWTSGNNYIDEFIQNTQLSAHQDLSKALEWIPYDKFYNIGCVIISGFNMVYRVKWIDGYIYKWDCMQQNWERKEQNRFVNVKSLGDLAEVTLETIRMAITVPHKVYGITQHPFTGKYMMVLSEICKDLDEVADVTLEIINKVITVPHKIYGITQNPKTKNYKIVWNEICEKCDCICYASRFKLNFTNWTSGNNHIDKFIQDAQLSTHKDLSKALEWIPYDKLYNVEYISKDGFDNKVYRARWIDGHIDEWNDKQQNWKRKDQNMSVILKRLCNSTDIMLEFTINEIIAATCKVYGITQDPETKNHMVVLNEIKIHNSGLIYRDFHSLLNQVSNANAYCITY
ncbi:kinase-like domain-containing protein [Rhizophagus clarus]|uniref:Kinase-like domain-containing protein n=1 Tax=Rhizophagus clarus TaxID=94130 RepID=A0A8H3QEZ5_9GLOM|nr:kinase-like domain-containing protein [Rhizophagus clarus]